MFETSRVMRKSSECPSYVQHSWWLSFRFGLRGFVALLNGERAGRLGARRDPLLFRRWRPEVFQPTPNHAGQTLAVDAVMAAPASTPHLDEPSLFEHPKVARRRGPTMVEARRQIA